ncbi:NHL repeat-containing protein [Chitinophaga tropicalis]|uniref:FlgD Ig-like domain-containing protein n=1 Tax=Chitinophaga tropicalis TaxID=2683588 RepID=A0A7K1U136_9BACT|nr:hypothetical protein [Chitinophaga tropicalis]MVT08006.1 hypothetical protein [Chitinophaga tropicalis]
MHTIIRRLLFSVASCCLFFSASGQQTTINFTLKEPGYVTLVVENNAGVRVRNLISETFFPAGKNTVQWDGMDDLGRDADAADHGEYHIPGRLVAPGQYRVRGIVRGKITPRYEFSAYATGNPPWRTDDHAGAWLSDHTAPQAALYVPGTASPTGNPTVLLGNYVAESADGMAWVDLDGRKRGGRSWLGGTWTVAPFLASDGKTKVYVASAWETAAKQPGVGELRLNELIPNKLNNYNMRKVLDFPLNAASHEELISLISGLTVSNGIVYISMGKRNNLLLIDVAKGKLIDSVRINAPGGLAIDGAGKLLVLSGNKLLRYPLTGQLKTAKAETVIEQGLEAPYALTQDKDGRIYISDRGKSHTVKVFSPAGKYLRAIGAPGIPAAGPYNPQHMNNPAGLTIDSQQQLWVTEADFLPKRVSVWSLDGKLLKAFYGPSKYGGGGTLDPQDKSRFYYAEEGKGAMEFSLNWQTGTSTLKQVYYRPDSDDQQLAFRNAAPETPFYVNGKKYFTNCYNNSPTSGQPTAFIFAERNGLVYPVAATGQAAQWDVLKDDAFRSSWPQGTDLRNKGQAFFIWQDKNGDTKVQPGEVSFQKGSNGGVTVMPDLSFCVSRLNGNAVRFSPTGYTERGVPLYNISQGKVLATGVLSPASSGGDQVLAGPDGWTVVTQGVKPFDALSLSGVKNGVAAWSYPDVWPGLHASHSAPQNVTPGELIGTTRLLGGLFSAKGSDAGPFWAVNGNHGNIYIFTADGLFVATLFELMRNGGKWRMHSYKRNMALDSLTLDEENFWPTINATADGKVYLVDGIRTAIVRLDGMETIKRLPDQLITVNQASLNRGLAALATTEAVRQQKEGSKELQVKILSAAPVVDGKLNEWSLAAWADIDKRGVSAYFNSNSKAYDVSGALAVASGRLYVAWKTGDAQLADNSGEMPTALFKTGGALDLMLGADSKAAPGRTAAVAGDCRLIVSVVNGKPQVLLYRAVVPGTKNENKIAFSSPSRTITFDKVDNVTNLVQFAASGGNYEISVPLNVFGLQVADGLKIKGDIGVLRGPKGETTSRVYWSNKATGLTADVPSEALLYPGLWGIFRFAK